MITQCVLVRKVLMNRAINFQTIKVILTILWNLGTNVAFQQLEQNMIQCEFEDNKKWDKIVDMSPWAIKGATLKLVPWQPSLSLGEINFSLCTFWIQLHNLPQPIK